MGIQRTKIAFWLQPCVLHLARARENAAVFGKTVKSGSHQRSLQMVLEGDAEATAIDSHVLDVLLLKSADLAAKLCIIDMLGPSTIPPVVAAKSLDNDLKYRIQEVLVNMHTDPEAAHRLHEGRIERFVPILDEDYNDISRMFTKVEAVEFPFT